MKTILLLFTLTASLGLADTTNIERVASKLIPAAQMDAILSGARQMGISTDEFIATTNLNSISIIPTGTNYTCYISIKPAVTEVTQTSTNGLSVVTRTINRKSVAPQTISSNQMVALFDAGIGAAGDISESVTVTNFRNIQVSAITNSPSTDWRVTVILK